MMEGRRPSTHDPEETFTTYRKFTLPVAMDEQETVIIPAAGRRAGAAASGRTPSGGGEVGERPHGWRRHALPVALSVVLVVLTVSGAAIFVSAAPDAGHPARSTAGAPQAHQAFDVSGAAAIPPTMAPTPTATRTPRPNPTATPVPPVNTSGGELCTDTTMFVPNISQWTVPPGCYATIYTPNQAAYPYRPGFGYCNWWVRERHLSHPDITENTSYPRGSTPVAGAAVWFDPNVQGASSAGHWSQVVAVAPDGYWFLVSEMNFGWRGGGFGKVSYRYAHVGSGVVFVYA